MTVHTSIHQIILIFMMLNFGVIVLGAGFLIYDIITGIRKMMKKK